MKFRVASILWISALSTLSTMLSVACSRDTVQPRSESGTEVATQTIVIEGNARIGESGSSQRVAFAQNMDQQLIFVFEHTSTAACAGADDDSLKQASSLTSGIIGSEGGFSISYNAAQLKQLTQPECITHSFLPAEISTFRVTATIDANAGNCEQLCDSTGSSNGCVNACIESGKIRALRRLTKDELLSVSEFLPSGEWVIRADLEFSEVLPQSSQSLVPDLALLPPALQSSVGMSARTFMSDSCALAEGCISASGARRLLIFDTEIFNLGGAEFEIGAPSSDDPLFEFASCHGHYHLRAIVRYELLTSDGEGLVALGQKLGFCLMDTERIGGSLPGRFDCEFQGITSGWSDVYDRSLDCQWLDVTDVPNGDYLLRLTVNPDEVFLEGDYSNNSVTVPVEVR